MPVIFFPLIMFSAFATLNFTYTWEAKGLCWMNYLIYLGAEAPVQRMPFFPGYLREVQIRM